VQSGAHPVVLAAWIEGSEELCARAIPTFACLVGRLGSDRLARLVVIASDEHDVRIRTNPGEQP